MKYFLLGAFASGFLLYGVAFFYGATASTRLDVIADAIARRPLEPFVLLGMALVLVGFGFKVALIPFQAWTPDAYEGAPTVVTAFMAVAVKAAAFAAFARFFSVSLGALAAQWTGLLALLAALTMTVGNVVAISQRSVAHARVLEHRARRLHAPRARPPAPRRAAPRSSTTWRSTWSCTSAHSVSWSPSAAAASRATGSTTSPASACAIRCSACA